MAIHGLFDHRPADDVRWYQAALIAGGDLAVTGQDVLLMSLLTPSRLLDMVRYFTVFDSKFANWWHVISRCLHSPLD